MKKQTPYIAAAPWQLCFAAPVPAHVFFPGGCTYFESRLTEMTSKKSTAVYQTLDK